MVQVSANEIGLANSYDDATAIPPRLIDLTSRGSLGNGAHLLSEIDATPVLGEATPFIVLDPTQLATVQTSNSSLFLSQHGFSLGQELTYLAGGGDVIPGLVDGETYYAIPIDGDTFQLAHSLTDANQGIHVSLGVGASRVM